MEWSYERTYGKRQRLEVDPSITRSPDLHQSTGSEQQSEPTEVLMRAQQGVRNEWFFKSELIYIIWWVPCLPNLPRNIWHWRIWQQWGHWVPRLRFTMQIFLQKRTPLPSLEGSFPDLLQVWVRVWEDFQKAWNEMWLQWGLQLACGLLGPTENLRIVGLKGNPKGRPTPCNARVTTKESLQNGHPTSA